MFYIKTKIADMLYCLFIDCKGDTDAEYRIPQSIGGYREQMDYNISAGNQIPARIPYRTAGLTAEENEPILAEDRENLTVALSCCYRSLSVR